MLATDRTAQGTVSRPLYTRAQLERLIAPRSIAVVGASPRAGSFGLRTLENLAHFRGPIWPVNGKYGEIGGAPRFSSPAPLPPQPPLPSRAVPRAGGPRAPKTAPRARPRGRIV